MGRCEHSSLYANLHGLADCNLTVAGELDAWIFNRLPAKQPAVSSPHRDDGVVVPVQPWHWAGPAPSRCADLCSSECIFSPCTESNSVLISKFFFCCVSNVCQCAFWKDFFHIRACYIPFFPRFRHTLLWLSDWQLCNFKWDDKNVHYFSDLCCIWPLLIISAMLPFILHNHLFCCDSGLQQFHLFSLHLPPPAPLNSWLNVLLVPFFQGLQPIEAICKKKKNKLVFVFSFPSRITLTF